MMTCAVAPGLATVATFASMFRKAAGVRKGGTARIFVHLMVGRAGNTGRQPTQAKIVAVEIAAVLSREARRHVGYKYTRKRRHGKNSLYTTDISRCRSVDSNACQMLRVRHLQHSKF